MYSNENQFTVCSPSAIDHKPTKVDKKKKYTKISCDNGFSVDYDVD